MVCHEIQMNNPHIYAGEQWMHKDVEWELTLIDQMPTHELAPTSDHNDSPDHYATMNLSLEWTAIRRTEAAHLLDRDMSNETAK